MKLTVFLMRSTVNSFGDCLRETYVNGERALQPVSDTSELPYPCAGYLIVKEHMRPKWLHFLETHFPMDLSNTSNGFLLLLGVGTRIFAISFGYAFHVLDSSKLEPDFGIRVCANSIDPRTIRTVDSRNIDVVTRQQRINLSSGSSIGEFGIELDQEWIRFLSGSPVDRQLADKLAGRDSLRINANIRLERLGEKCAELLTLFQSDRYRENFSFLDHFNMLRKGDPLIAEVDRVLLERFTARSNERISIAMPYLFPDEFQLERYKISKGHTRVEVEELTLETIYAFLDDHPEIDEPFSQVKIIGLDDHGQACTRAHDLGDHVVAEIDYQGRTFLHTGGSWFRVETAYATTVRERVAQIEDVTDSLQLPTMVSGEQEREYNRRAAAERGWLNLDRNLITLSERFQRVEVCDLLTADHTFICVKKMYSSSTLSHLFAQGAVSAELFRYDADYRNRVSEIGASFIDVHNLAANPPKFVFAIATGKPDPLCDSMFLFSAIHLAKQARSIERLGYSVALARISLGQT